MQEAPLNGVPEAAVRAAVRAHECAWVAGASREDLVRATLEAALPGIAAQERCLARVRAYADSLLLESHPTHDHSCPDDVRKALLAALDDSEEAERG